MLDEQRALIRLVFAKLILDEGKLSWEYSRAFKILSEAVSETNCSKVAKIDDFENGKFEHRKKSDVTGQKGNLLPPRPIWLPKPAINPTSVIEPIIAVFKNGAIAEQTRERLKQIKLLSSNQLTTGRTNI